MGNLFSRDSKLPPSEEKSSQKRNREEEGGKSDPPRINEEPKEKKKRLNEERDKCSNTEHDNSASHPFSSEKSAQKPKHLEKYEALELGRANEKLVKKEIRSSDKPSDIESNTRIDLHSDSSIICSSLVLSSDASASMLNHQLRDRPISRSPITYFASKAPLSLMTQQSDESLFPSSTISSDDKDVSELDGYSEDESDDSYENESDESSEDESDYSDDYEFDDDFESDDSYGNDFENKAISVGGIEDKANS